jgi:hypothetical protein
MFRNLSNEWHCKENLNKDKAVKCVLTQHVQGIRKKMSTKNHRRKIKAIQIFFKNYGQGILKS